MASAPPLVAIQEDEHYRPHLVAEGDTLTRLAVHYGCTEQAIKRWCVCVSVCVCCEVMTTARIVRLDACWLICVLLGACVFFFSLFRSDSNHHKISVHLEGLIGQHIRVPKSNAPDLPPAVLSPEEEAARARDRAVNKLAFEIGFLFAVTFFRNRDISCHQVSDLTKKDNNGSSDRPRHEYVVIPRFVPHLRHSGCTRMHACPRERSTNDRNNSFTAGEARFYLEDHGYDAAEAKAAVEADLQWERTHGAKVKALMKQFGAHS
jgi:hypothetical protein